ncbi:hypothetical protein HHK36_009735 [Tetracentron sinense]|uniref:BZIP domain-containing protein n=1 Tax=Tetracentron sinense TaxID=13715 RepID=A0A834ZDS0_TETSI|nr:hypothetical protein HHK36_009735 [Tetracentron sinense]
MASLEGMFELPFPVFEGGFTPWESQDPMPIFQPENPVSSKSVAIVDERKQRRMLSNRESARRSRMRKRRHLEDLRNQANRLRTTNRDIANRLGVVTHHCHLIRRDNDRLRLESAALSQKLSDIRRFLIFRQLQQFSSLSPFNIVSTFNEQTPSPSLIA